MPLTVTPRYLSLPNSTTERFNNCRKQRIYFTENSVTVEGLSVALHSQWKTDTHRGIFTFQTIAGREWLRGMKPSWGLALRTPGEFDYELQRYRHIGWTNLHPTNNNTMPCYVFACSCWLVNGTRLRGIDKSLSAAFNGTKTRKFRVPVSRDRN